MTRRDPGKIGAVGPEADWRFLVFVLALDQLVGLGRAGWSSSPGNGWDRGTSSGFVRLGTSTSLSLGPFDRRQVDTGRLGSVGGWRGGGRRLSRRVGPGLGQFLDPG